MTKRYFWLTDPHLNFVTKAKLLTYFIELQDKNPDGLFITGDISNGLQIAKHLKWLSRVVHCPIYFTLGNHDFYQSSFEAIEKSMVSLMEAEPNLIYLTQKDPISLSSTTALIGHDGWYDAGWRTPITPLVFIWDFFFIKDFRSLFSNEERMEVVKERARLASISIAKKLCTAFEAHSEVYLLTHFPPWPDPRRWLIEKFWMPYNSSKIVAGEISQIMAARPDKKLIILAGHTHRTRTEQISPNIELRVGAAQHNVCQVQGIIFIEDK